MAALEDIKASAHKIPSKAGNRAREDMPRQAALVLKAYDKALQVSNTRTTG